MIVKKFQADTLEGALKAVKSELGIKAIILKTQKLYESKGTLKEKKYEITAGLKENEINLKLQKQDSLVTDSTKISQNSIEEETRNIPSSFNQDFNSFKDKVELDIDQQNETISRLENELKSIRSEFTNYQKSIKSTESFKTTLKSFNLSDSVVNLISKHLRFEVQDSHEIPEELFNEIVMREISQIIKISQPKFSFSTNNKESAITVLVSSACCGQTSMAYKMACMVPKACVVTYGERRESSRFQEKLLGIESYECSTIHELVGKVSSEQGLGKNVFVDIGHNLDKNIEDTKRTLASLKRSFNLVDIVLCLSGVHSEAYNLRECHKYGEVIDGLVVSYVDLSMNLTSLVNIQHETSHPLYFFSTGPVVPRDIEPASKEKILSEIFEI